MRTTRIGLTVAAMLMAGSAAQAQVSDDAVKIGVLTDHSGRERLYHSLDHATEVG